MSNFDIVARFPDTTWLEETARKLDDKMRYAVEKANEVDFIPYSTRNQQYAPTHIGMWTNGFWPATMWQMYLATKDDFYRAEAVRTEKMLDQALYQFKNLSHDVGFMWLIQSGVHYDLEKNQDSYDRTLFAANMLAARFNPAGFIRAWNPQGREGWAIIDCMMNLPLLYWASDMTNDPRYRLIAMKHADTTLKYFVRPDGSVNHIVCFDPETGEYMYNLAGQGYEPDSSWSRGQSWALYGFTLSYLATGKPEYLSAAKRIAHYFIANVADDYIPRCDFRQPAEPNINDNAAGAIASCALLELCQIVPEHEGKAYYQAAVRMLMAMEKECINWEKDNPALLTKCSHSYHNIVGRHITMNYGDYYFIEAINKLRGQKKLFWQPHK